MDLVRTLGVAIDPSGARSGGAAAESAFRKVGQAAKSMEKEASGGVRNLTSSLLSLKTAVAGIATSFLVSELLKTGAATDRLSNMLRYATGSMSAANREMAFADNLSRRLGLEVESMSLAYGKFVAVGRLSKLTYSEIRDTFEGVADASAVMALSSEESSGAILALTQMLSKGKVTAEELNQQLAERIPGAVTLMAQAVGVTTQELGRMMERGELIASDVLPKFGAELKKQFGPEASRNATTTTGAINNLKNAWTDFKKELIDAGIIDVLKRIMEVIVTVVRNLMTLPGFIRKATAEVKAGLSDFVTPDSVFGKILGGVGGVIGGFGDWAKSVSWDPPSRRMADPALPDSETNIIRMPKFKTRPSSMDNFRAGLVGDAREMTSMGSFTTVDGMTQQVERHMGQLEKSGKETTDALASNFTDFFGGMVTEGGNAIDRLRNMFSSLAKDIATIFARRTIAEPLAGALSLFASGLFGGTPVSTGTGGAPTGSIMGNSVFTGIHHAGGIAGSGSAIGRMVDSSLFANAPRFHNGLAPDEFPAILQRGEAVIPKSQVGNMAAGGDVNITVNVDGSKGGSPEGNQRLGSEIARQIEAVIDQRIARAAMPRGILSR